MAKPTKYMKLLIISSVLVIGLAITTTTLLVFSGAITVTNSPISRESVINDASVYASTNQTAIDHFVDNIDLSVDPSLQTTATPKFTILTNLVLFDSNQKEYPKTIPTDVELAKNSLVDEQGRLLDLGSVQFTFDGIGTLQNKNLEISATAIFCLDTQCDEKKLYRQGTLQNNRISLYVGDSFAEPAIGQRNFDYTFTFADEKWLYVGEDEIYNLKMAVNQQKTVVYDEQLKAAISIFKKDNVFQVCADSGSAGTGFGAASTSVVNTPDVTINVNGEYYDKIPSLRGVQNSADASRYFLENHIQSGEYVYPDICKSVNMPRNAKVDVVTDGKTLSFYTPKSQANFFLECHNEAYGVGAKETQYGNSRYVNYAEKFICTSNIGYSK